MDKLVYGFYIILPIVLFLKAKLYKKGEWNEGFMSLTQTKALQGYFAILIMFHHIAQKTCASWLRPNVIRPGLELFVPVGYLFVSVFFFCSGYGLLKSYRNKDNYLDGFLKKRIVPLVFAYYLSGYIFLIVRYFMKEKMSTRRLISYVTGIRLSNYYAWFVIALPIFYLGFYFSFRFCKKEGMAIFMTCLVVFVYTLLGTMIDHNDFWMRGEWWYNSVHMFSVGLLFAKFEKNIIAFMKRKYVGKLGVCILFAYVSFVISEMMQGILGYYGEAVRMEFIPKVLCRWGCLISQMIAAFLFVVTILMLGLKIRIGNRMLDFFGKTTLEFYLIHGLFVELFGFSFLDVAKPLYYIKNVAIYTIVVLICAVPSALLFRILLKLFQGKKNKTLVATMLLFACLIIPSMSVYADEEEMDQWHAYYIDNNFGISSVQIALFPGEQYRITYANIGAVVFQSDNPAVAEVSSDGVVTAKSVGAANIKVISEKYGIRNCEVSVVEDKGQFVEPIQGYEFPITDKKTVLEYDQFDLYIDKGMYMNPDMPKVLSDIMDAIEKVTGYKFYPGEGKGENERLIFEAINGYYVEPSGGESGITLDASCIASLNLSTDYASLVHELLHVAQSRNTGYLGNILAEGYAESYVDEVLASLPYTSSTTERDRMVCYPISDENYDFVEIKNENDFVKYFTNPSDSHPTSFYTVEYIREKYGDKVLYQIINEISKQEVYSSNDKIWKIIKSFTSENFMHELYEYYMNYDRTCSIGDYTDQSVLKPQYPNFSRLDEFTMHVYGSDSTIRYKNSILFDFREAFAFAQQNLGKKVGGIHMEVCGNKNATASFYDASGELLHVVRLNANSQVEIEVAKAVAVRFTNTSDGEINELRVLVSGDKQFGLNMFDIEKVFETYPAMPDLEVCPVSPEGHKFENYVSNKNGTCVKDGTKTAFCENEGCMAYDCVEDSGSKNENVHVGNYQIDENSAYNSSCDKEGYEGDIICSQCKKVVQKGTIILKKQHDYNAPVVKWSENHQDAWAEYTCKNNATHVKKENLIVDIEMSEAPTCSKKGKTRYTAYSATLREEVEIEDINFDLSVHDWNKEYTVDLKATNKKSGKKSIHCLACDAKKDVIAIPKQVISTVKSKTLKASKLKKKKISFSLKTKVKGKAKISYKVTKYPKGAKKYISVTKSGKVTLKKGAKKGNYTITISSASTKEYQKVSKKYTIKVK